KKKLKKTSFDLNEWIISIAIFSSLILLYSIFKKVGIFNGININNREITYLIAFLIGLVASLSACFAIVGSIVLGFNQRLGNLSNDKSVLKILKPNLLFHVGRILTFFILGGILGLIGGSINLSGKFVSIYTIFIAIILFILSLNILGLKLSIFNIRLKPLRKTFSLIESLKKRTSGFTPFILGGVTFFLPCGFTQSMQIFSLTTGSFMKGGLVLMFFSLGTFPTLFILGVFSRVVKLKNLSIFNKVIGLIILTFAIFTLNSGLSLINFESITSSNLSNLQTENSLSENVNDYQVVYMHVKYSGFEPNVIRIKKGVPVKWVIYSDEVTGCTNRIIVPSLNISKNISSYETIITFTPKEKGVILFSCWMGMVRGKFI
ncbi:MAG: sulfite exporter TauE/SafE family protein, partial [Candidatus Ratteibacteria bacterium]